ncbi:MAG: autotransporter outer membrane beta-barrel domain-containing protein [Planctomycetes bacterium]|nr:autotransporter outer membrane beta-barrel domain-containing protein [Planctomycetota bacterium]
MTGSVLGGTGMRVDADGVLSGTGRVDGPVENLGVIASLNSLPQYSQAGPSDFAIGPLTNAGTIRLAGGTVGNTLTVRGDLLSDSGRLELNTALGGDDSPTDKLILDGGDATSRQARASSVAGTTEVIVHNKGGLGGQTEIGIMVVEARNGATTTDDSFFLSALTPGYRGGLGTVVAGAFDYHLVRGGNGGDENSWYMVSREGVRPEPGNYLVNREAAETLFFHTLHDRLLGYQQITDPATGRRLLGAAWARMQYGRASQDSCMAGMSSSTRTFVAQTGMDVWRGESAFGIFSAGVMMGFGTAEGEVDSQFYDGTVKSNLNGYVLGAYATWFQDRTRATGLYADIWLQHAWFRNRTSGGGLPGERFSSRLWSGSLETGYAFPLFTTGGSAWSLVPTVQLAYNSYRSGDFTEENGTVVSHTDRNRFLARTGVRLKGRVDSLGPVAAEPYVEMNWLHKTKQTGVSLNEHTLTLDSPRNMYEVKLGLESEIRPNIRVGVGVAGQFGKRNYRSYSGQIGLRVDW